MNASRLAWLGLSLSIGFSLASCRLGNDEKSSNGVKASEVCYIGTPAYAKRIASFTFSPEAAEQLIMEHLARGGDQPNPLKRLRPLHQAVMGQCYHFYMPNKFGRIPWAGYYVNGHTGQIEFRNGEGFIPEHRSKTNAE